MAAILDFDRLLAPISGDDPAGKPVSFVARQKLDTARKSVNPSDYAANDPLRPAEAKPADWSGIVSICSGILEDESKDLMTAARLTEALTRIYGFPGLRDGVTLLRRMIEECWDRLTPPIEDGDLEVRAAPFNWLDDPDRGARFPSTVRSIPLLEDSDGKTISWIDWKTAQSAPAPAEGEEDPRAIFQAKFDKAVLAADRQTIQDMVDAGTAALAEAERIDTIVLEKLGDDAPGVGEWRNALNECVELTKRVLEKKGPAPYKPGAVEAAPSAPDSPVAESGNAITYSGNGHSAAQQPRPLTRDDAYRQLDEAAALLQRLEPHSPIPYMVQRAVSLGRLPFPELMKVMIRDAGVVSQLNRELGLSVEDA
jgi:type VI secretion system protein ImpA